MMFYPDRQRLIEREMRMYRSELKETMPDDLQGEVAGFVEYVHERLSDESLSVNTALDACGLRSHRVRSKLRYALGRTPHQYIEYRRIEAAIRLLQFPELDLQDIAYGVGYEYDTFLRAFRNQTGETPSVFRGKRRGDIEGQK